jgi:hypothetical protein
VRTCASDGMALPLFPDFLIQLNAARQSERSCF